MKNKACIVTVGNEILKGKTVNTNASHIGRVLSFLGYEVVRGIVVPDNEEDIIWAFRNAMFVSDLVVSSGGLGPTFDDMTLNGLAKALEVELEVNEEALGMIKKKYDSMGVELTEERIKMAKLPEKSKALKNPVGTAPGVYLERGDKKVLVLPGVPAEMKAILEEMSENLRFNGRSYYEESVDIKGIMESAMAPVIDKIMKKHSGEVYIKSHPKHSENRNPELEIEVSASAETKEEATKRVKATLEEIVLEAEKMRG